MKSIILLIVVAGFGGIGLQAQMPDLKSMTDAVAKPAETDSSQSDALTSILSAIEQGAAAYPEQTSAIAKQLEAMTGGKIPSRESLTGLARAVQSVWSSGSFNSADAEKMASTLNSVLNSAGIPLPAWAGNLKNIQDLLEKNGVSTEQAIAFGSQLKDYVLALSK
ncbi:MAG: hypothetical protein R3F07_12605 [Opitutaceae bacterium]